MADRAELLYEAVKRGIKTVSSLDDNDRQLLRDYMGSRSSTPATREPPDSAMMGSISQSEADAINAAQPEPYRPTLGENLKRSYNAGLEELRAQHAADVGMTPQQLTDYNRNLLQTSPVLRPVVQGLYESQIVKAAAPESMKQLVAQTPAAQGVGQNLLRIGGQILGDAPLFSLAGAAVGGPAEALAGKVAPYLSPAIGKAVTQGTRFAAEMGAVGAAEELPKVLTGEESLAGGAGNVLQKAGQGYVLGNVLGAAGYGAGKLGEALKNRKTEGQVLDEAIARFDQKVNDFAAGRGITKQTMDEAATATEAIAKPITTPKTADEANAYIESRLSLNPAKPAMPTIERLYSQAVDRLQPINRMVKNLTKDAPLAETENPYSQAVLAKGWQGKGQGYLNFGVFDSKGNQIADSLEDVLKPVADDIRSFRNYATARRAVELGKRNITTGYALDDAAEAVKLLGSPARQQAFDNLVKFQGAVLDETMLRSGMMSEEAVKAMRSLNQEYVPFYRVFDFAESGPRGQGDTFVNMGQIIKKLKGSERDIVDPLESVIKNTYALTNAAERNKVGASLASLVDRNPELAAQWMQKVDGATNAAKEGVVSVWRNGVRETYKVDPDLYASLTHLDKEMSNVLIDVLATPAGWLRAGATSLSLDFPARNIVKDQWSAFMNTKYGYNPPIDFFKGLFSAAKEDGLYAEYLRSGAAQSSLVSFERNYLKKSLNELTQGGVLNRVKALATNPLDALRGLSELGEQATRLGAFGKAKAKVLAQGGSYEEALMKAAQEARDITLDFGRRGSKTGIANRTIAFFNAAIQGTDKMVRMMKEDPVGYGAKAFASITIPSLVLWNRNKDDPRYAELPQWQKDLFWIIYLNDKPDAVPIRIPKPLETGLLFGSAFERAADYMVKKDPQAFKEFGSNLKDAFTPSFMFTALAPWINVYSNKSLFTGAPIVPSREQKLPPEMQAGPYTSETAKKLGQLTKQSPRQIEELVRGYGGGAGRAALELSDLALKTVGQGGKIPKPATDWTSLPMIRGFVIQPNAQSKSINDFYEQMNKLETVYAGQQAGGAKVPPKDISELLRLRQANEVMSLLNSQERDVQNSPKMSPEEKKRRLDELNMKQTDLARKVLRRTP